MSSTEPREGGTASRQMRLERMGGGRRPIVPPGWAKRKKQRLPETSSAFGFPAKNGT